MAIGLVDLKWKQINLNDWFVFNHFLDSDDFNHSDLDEAAQNVCISLRYLKKKTNFSKEN